MASTGNDNTATRLAVAAIVLLLSACTPISQSILPESSAPQRFNHEANARDAAVVESATWWRHFNDQRLNQLVEQALASNISLAQAKLRIERTRILLGHSGDDYLPAIHARTKSVDSPDARNAFFQYGFDASWEFGLFGRSEATRNLAKASLLSAETAESAVRTVMVAEVVRHYLELRAHQQQAALLSEQKKVLEQEQQLLAVKQRLQLPMLEQQASLQQQLLQLENKMLEQQQQTEMSAQHLAVLLGKNAPDAQWLQAQSLPRLAPFSIDVMPAELLRSRADVRSAEAEVLRAASELGIAKAELYPHIALGSSYYFAVDITRSVDLNNPSHSTLGIGPFIDIPLFDWGQRRAAVHANELQLQETLLAYKQAVLEAVGETEIALSSLQWQAKGLQQSEQQDKLLQQHADKQAIRMQQGFSSKLDQLALEQQRLEQQLSAVEVQMQYSLAFVALYKTLGGASLSAAGE